MKLKEEIIVFVVSAAFATSLSVSSINKAEDSTFYPEVVEQLVDLPSDGEESYELWGYAMNLEGSKGWIIWEKNIFETNDEISGLAGMDTLGNNIVVPCPREDSIGLCFANRAYPIYTVSA